MTATLGAPASLEDKIDALAARVESIAAELEVARLRRESRDDLRDTLVPIAGDALALATVELDRLRADGSLDELVSLVRRLVAASGSLEKAVSALETATALMGDAAPLSGEVIAALTTRLAALDEKGYFAFARHSAAVLERVVTSFDEDDIDALGDNVVLILQTVREMTQPEVMQMLRRTATAVQAQQHAIESGDEKTPSLWQLLRQMRQPEVRRGLSRAIGMLRVVAADAPPAEVHDTKGDG
jgi:uncharacterized protein YjgD (DUF1641 family)